MKTAPVKTTVCALLAMVSSALAAEPVALFNGNDLAQWETRPGTGKSLWVVGEPAVSKEHPEQLIANGTRGAMVNLAVHHGDSLDIYSKAKFGDCRIELDLMLAKASNSGIYVMGEYEVQVFDSSGKPDAKLEAIDMGAIYGAAVPKVNACKPPGEWQHYVIEWQAPRFDTQGVKIANGRFVSVMLNGKTILENLEIKGPTPAGLTGKEHAEGPLMFQGNHGPVSYKNILVTPR
jgi:hypothetical protein